MNQASLEAVAESLGKTSRRTSYTKLPPRSSDDRAGNWAVALVALVVGAVIGLVVAARRTTRSAAPGDQQPVSPAQTAPTTVPAASQAHS